MESQLYPLNANCFPISRSTENDVSIGTREGTVHCIAETIILILSNDVLKFGSCFKHKHDWHGPCFAMNSDKFLAHSHIGFFPKVIDSLCHPFDATSWLFIFGAGVCIKFSSCVSVIIRWSWTMGPCVCGAIVLTKDAPRSWRTRNIWCWSSMCVDLAKIVQLRCWQGDCDNGGWNNKGDSLTNTLHEEVAVNTMKSSSFGKPNQSQLQRAQLNNMKESRKRHQK